MIAAPLKPFRRAPLAPLLEEFRDHVIAAPLKLGGFMDGGDQTGEFRDHVIAAPLKRGQLFPPACAALNSAIT